MKKRIKLTESELVRLVQKVISEQTSKVETEKILRDREISSQNFKKIKESLSTFMSPKIGESYISWSDSNWFLQIRMDGGVLFSTDPKWGYVPPFGIFDEVKKTDYSVDYNKLSIDDFIKKIKNLLTEIQEYVPKTKDSVRPSTKPKYGKRINDPSNYFPLPNAEKPYQHPYSVHGVKPTT
jgi:hypothetical protein